MRIPRIFHPETLSVDKQVSLTSDAVNHIVNVLRLKAGHPIVLFNGDGNEYSGTLDRAERRQALVQVDAKLSLSLESPLKLHLAPGISKGDRMEWVIQKAVELGVSDITPVITERCAIKLPPQRWEKKLQQWQKVMIGACEQSGRNVLPELHPICTTQEWIQQSTNQLRLILQPKSTKHLSELSVSPTGVRLLVGPEGGLTEQEVYSAEQTGFQSIAMGPRIMRTETAAITAVSVIQALHGDL